MLTLFINSKIIEMKKISLSIVIIAIGLMIITKSNAQNAKPEKVYSFVKVDKPAKWYKEQSEK